MSQSPPAALVRLHEADVVRLGGRLAANVEDGGVRHAWVELPGEIAPAAMRWFCSCDAQGGPLGAGAPAGALACGHVAAILTAWIHSPGDFVEPDVPASA